MDTSLSQRQFSSSKIVYLLLGAILLAGLALRTWNINFDGGLNAHPDERSTTCFYAPTIGWPASFEEFRDPRRSPLNPLWDRNSQSRRSFTYGHFPLYLGILTGELLSRLAGPASALPLPERTLSLLERASGPCAGIAFSGRLTMALLDTATIFLLFLLGRRLYGRGAGLLAAGLYAFTAQAVQLSHFFAMDPASTTFVVLSAYGGVLMAQTRARRGVVLAGLGAGLAISAKFSALPILAVPAAGAVLGSFAAGEEREAQLSRWRLAAKQAALSLLAALAAFLVTSPYAVLDWRSFLQATIVEQGGMVRGVADFPFTRQYRNTLPYLYFIEQQLIWGMGLPLGLTAAAGALWALARAALRRCRASELVVWAWLVPYFGITGAFLAKFNRYMSPVLPFVLLFAAGLIAWLWRRGSARRRGMALRLPSVMLAVCSLGGGLLWTLAFVNGVYASEHTWVTASRWIYANAPAGSVILWELWDDPLPKGIPGEPGMDMGSHGLRHIDWSPYEEDTAEKYEVLRSKLQEADYVIYSSKRIYESVDELPERYPMTIRYYRLMFEEALGFALAADITSPPRLLGVTFPDQDADESWSLYDHPRVSIFVKKRQIGDVEFDALLGGTWEGAIAWHRGREPPLAPLLNALGLGSSPESRDKGMINAVIALLGVQELAGGPGPAGEDGARAPSLLLDRPLGDLPVVDSYRWNAAASRSPWLAVGWWWLVVSLLGLLAWPLAFTLFRGLRDRGFLLTKTIGWMLSGWLLWMLASLDLAHNTVRNAWLVAASLMALSAALAYVMRRQMGEFLRRSWKILLFGELLFGAAYIFFVLIRQKNPDIWQPWFGGEKFMEFAFLNGILRSPVFPPVDPHFAGGYVNYYYFGIYLVAFLVKLTGIYAEVAFNLAIPTLFALTVVNAFAVAYSAVPLRRLPGGAREATADGGPGHRHPQTERETELAAMEERGHGGDSSGAGTAGPRGGAAPGWQEGIGAALLAPLFVALLGNLAGFGQLLQSLARNSRIEFDSGVAVVDRGAAAIGGLWRAIAGGSGVPGYDFWAPSRVVPHTINEFPFWSFTYADLHPHLIGIPFSLLFLALTLTLLKSYALDWGRNLPYAALLLAGFTFTLGVLAVVNLWELPTYFSVGIAALAVTLFRKRGRLRPWVTAIVGVLQLGGAFLLFQPFFRSYTNVAASGVGLVRAPDGLGEWAQIWGFFGFVLVSWLLVSQGSEGRSRFLRRHRLLVRRVTAAYACGALLQTLLVLVSALLLLFSNQTILAICLPLLGLSLAKLWRRSRAFDAGALFAALLTTAGLAILAGTQIFYLKDFLHGGDAYRMNTLFKFFNHVWVLWGTAAAVVLPAILADLARRERGPGTRLPEAANRGFAAYAPFSFSGLAPTGKVWAAVFLLLLCASLAYPIFGTPARLSQRFPGWRPPVGTLDGLAFMRNGVYYWPDQNHAIELRFDWEAVQWLLATVRGNVVLAESAQIDYYRAGGTRVASLTGLSGLLGMHEGEQRYGEDVGERHAKLNEFWRTEDRERVRELISELNIGLIYVGQLERHQHPAAPERLRQLEASGYLKTVFANAAVTIYAAPPHWNLQAAGR